MLSRRLRRATSKGPTDPYSLELFANHEVIGYWFLDELSTGAVKDYSGNGYDLDTFEGSRTFGNTPVNANYDSMSSSASNNSAQVSLGADSNWDDQPIQTFIFWEYRVGTTPTYTYASFGTDNGTTDDWVYRFQNEYAGNRYYKPATRSTSEVTTTYRSNTSSHLINRIEMHVVTFNKTAGLVYQWVNGAPQTTRSIVGTPKTKCVTASNSKFAIGGRGGSRTDSLNGRMNGCSYTLNQPTNAEVTALWNAGT